MASIKSLLVPSKEVEIDYPGLDGFKVTIAFLGRETLQNIRKKAIKSTFTRGKLVEEVDDDLFLKLYVDASIKGWKGFKLAYLEQLAPVELGNANPEDLIDYNQDEALALMKSSPAFDTFISEQVTDLGNFSKNK